ncbi:PASTA domain-containing protein [Flavobacteriaceae bacterium]|nr:PASTA domain-containing protein [Flavobacteriaceae bacterium]
MRFVRFVFSRTFLKQLLLIGLFLTFIIVGLLIWLNNNTNHGQEITVPDLSRLTLDEAESELARHQLTLAILDTTNFNPSFPYATVIEQIPAAGARVKQDRKIYLSINRSGYKSMTVPFVLGKTLRQAKPALRAGGFSVGEITYKKYIAKDEVLEMSFRGRALIQGSKLPKTSVIDLVLGDGTGGLKVEALDPDSAYRDHDKRIKRSNDNE